MPKTLTLSEPELTAFNDGTRKVGWDLLDENGDGYFISWIEAACDAMKPECMAFPCKHDKRGVRSIRYREQAVSYNSDAALALRDVMEQLKEKHGYTYEPEDTAEPVYLLPGEVVADGNR